MQHTKAKYLLIVFSFCVMYFQSFCQDTSLTDSLTQLLHASNPDSNKVILLNDLAWELKISDPEKAGNYPETSVWLSKKYHEKSKPVFKPRMDIYTGLVVAGIVRSKNFTYDIWGIENTALRMESSGGIGKINIFQSIYDLVKDDFNCIYYGKIKT